MSISNVHLPNSGVSSDCNECLNFGSDCEPFSSYLGKAVRAVDQHLMYRIVSLCLLTFNLQMLSMYPEPIEVVLHDPIVLAVRIEQDAQSEEGAGTVGLQYLRLVLLLCRLFGGLIFSSSRSSGIRTSLCSRF